MIEEIIMKTIGVKYELEILNEFRYWTQKYHLLKHLFNDTLISSSLGNANNKFNKVISAISDSSPLYDFIKIEFSFY